MLNTTRKRGIILCIAFLTILLVTSRTQPAQAAGGAPNSTFNCVVDGDFHTGGTSNWPPTVTWDSDAGTEYSISIVAGPASLEGGASNLKIHSQGYAWGGHWIRVSCPQRLDGGTTLGGISVTGNLVIYAAMGWNWYDSPGNAIVMVKLQFYSGYNNPAGTMTYYCALHDPTDTTTDKWVKITNQDDDSGGYIAYFGIADSASGRTVQSDYNSKFGSLPSGLRVTSITLESYLDGGSLGGQLDACFGGVRLGYFPTLYSISPTSNTDTTSGSVTFSWDCEAPGSLATLTRNTYSGTLRGGVTYRCYSDDGSDSGWISGKTWTRTYTTKGLYDPYVVARTSYDGLTNTQNFGSVLYGNGFDLTPTFYGEPSPPPTTARMYVTYHYRGTWYYDQSYTSRISGWVLDDGYSVTVTQIPDSGGSGSTSWRRYTSGSTSFTPVTGTRYYVDYYFQYQPTITTVGLGPTYSATITYYNGADSGTASVNSGTPSWSGWTDANLGTKKLSIVDTVNGRQDAGGTVYERWHGQNGTTPSWTVDSGFTKKMVFKYQQLVTLTIAYGGGAIHNIGITYTCDTVTSTPTYTTSFNLFVDNGTSVTASADTQDSTSLTRWHVYNGTISCVKARVIGYLFYFNQYKVTVSPLNEYSTALLWPVQIRFTGDNNTGSDGTWAYTFSSTSAWRWMDANSALYVNRLARNSTLTNEYYTYEGSIQPHTPWRLLQSSITSWQTFSPIFRHQFRPWLELLSSSGVVYNNTVCLAPYESLLVYAWAWGSDSDARPVGYRTSTSLTFTFTPPPGQGSPDIKHPSGTDCFVTWSVPQTYGNWKLEITYTDDAGDIVFDKVIDIWVCGYTVTGLVSQPGVGQDATLLLSVTPETGYAIPRYSFLVMVTSGVGGDTYVKTLNMKYFGNLLQVNTLSTKFFSDDGFLTWSAYVHNLDSNGHRVSIGVLVTDPLSGYIYMNTTSLISPSIAPDGYAWISQQFNARGQWHRNGLFRVTYYIVFYNDAGGYIGTSSVQDFGNNDPISWIQIRSQSNGVAGILAVFYRSTTSAGQSTYSLTIPGSVLGGNTTTYYYVAFEDEYYVSTKTVVDRLVLDKTPPSVGTIQATYPGIQNAAKTGTIITIKVDAWDDVLPSTCTVTANMTYLGGNPSIPLILTYNPTSYLYEGTYTVPSGLTSGTYSFSVKVTDASGNVATSTGSALVDNTLPLQVVRTAPGNATATPSHIIMFIWLETSDPLPGSGVINYYTVQVASNPSFTLNVHTYIVSGTTTSKQPTDSFANGVWYWRIWATDGAGNNGTTVTWLFTADDVKPVVSNVIQTPSIVTYLNQVRVNCSASDTWTYLQSMTLVYWTDSNPTPNYLSMGAPYSGNTSNGWWSVIIPAKPYPTTVYYYVVGQDLAGNYYVTTTTSYIVGDNLAPGISSVYFDPSTPEGNQNVMVYATITEDTWGSGVKAVTIFFSINGSGNWLQSSMSLSGGVYSGTILAQVWSSQIRFYIFAVDNANNLRTSNSSAGGPFYSYVVADFHAPTIGVPTRNPSTIVNYNVSVSISVTVVENPSNGASGIYNVTLRYSIDSMNWFDVSMTFSGGKWSANIPKQPYNTLVEHYIVSFDRAGNRAEAYNGGSPYSYTVNDKYAPVINSVIRNPVVVPYNFTVTVNMEIYEPINASGMAGGSASVTLWYRVNHTTTFFVTATYQSGTLWWAVIQKQVNGSFVEYWLVAQDYAGNSISTISRPSNYTVCDIYPPAISDIQTTPVSPSTIVKISVLVVEPSGSCGVYNVTLYYRLNASTSWVTITMVLNSSTLRWAASVPGQPFNTTVTYYIISFDKMYNVGNSGQKQYLVSDVTPPKVVFLSQTPLTSVMYYHNVTITANATDDFSKVTSVSVYWTINGTWNFAPGSYNATRHLWVIIIPAQSYWKLVVYYISANDTYGNRGIDNYMGAYYWYQVGDNRPPTFDPVVRPPDSLTLEKVNISISVLEPSMGSGVQFARIFIDYSYTNTTWTPLLVAYMTKNGTIYTFCLNSSISFYIRFSIQVSDNANNLNYTSSFYFHINKRASALVTPTSPLSGEYSYPLSGLYFNITDPATLRPISGVTVELVYTLNGGVTWILAQSAKSFANGTVHFIWNITAPPGRQTFMVRFNGNPTFLPISQAFIVLIAKGTVLIGISGDTTTPHTPTTTLKGTVTNTLGLRLSSFNVTIEVYYDGNWVTLGEAEAKNGIWQLATNVTFLPNGFHSLRVSYAGALFQLAEANTQLDVRITRLLDLYQTVPSSPLLYSDFNIFQGGVLNLTAVFTNPDGVSIMVQLIDPHGMRISVPSAAVIVNSTFTIIWVSPTYAYDGSYTLKIFATDGAGTTLLFTGEILVNENSLSITFLEPLDDAAYNQGDTVSMLVNVTYLSGLPFEGNVTISFGGNFYSATQVSPYTWAFTCNATILGNVTVTALARSVGSVASTTTTVTVQQKTQQQESNVELLKAIPWVVPILSAAALLGVLALSLRKRTNTRTTHQRKEWELVEWVKSNFFEEES